MQKNKIFSIYAKILGETNFRTWEIPRSGSKVKDGERERKDERLNDGDNNGQVTHGARKLAWPRKPPGPKIIMGDYNIMFEHSEGS